MARRRRKLDTEIQRLYGLPLSEFTAARNGLAKQLRKAGDRADAEEVASLPKPSVSAWAVNHLFTAESDQMDKLLTAGEGARKALKKIFSGGEPGALRTAIQEARDLANKLRDRAVAAVAAESRPPGQAIVERIATNLQSLAFSPAAEPVVERGWLDVDLPPPGFEVLAGLQLAAGSGKPQQEAPAASKPASAKRPTLEESQTKKEREAAQAKARREREKARDQARRDRLAHANAAREEAAGRADFLRRKVEQAERAAEEARERYEEAEQTAEEARKRAAEAERALAKAAKAAETAKRSAG
ncbi:MAG TPA: hypothetical protein VE078_03915 [Thermoanaerobaculia bacterium]|nr:hypothetical protein [Thermoanaerobaculia bacterium]